LQTLTETPAPMAIDVPANGQALEGPDINFNGVRLPLTPHWVHVFMFLMT